MNEKVIIIEPDGSAYVCDSIRKAATLTGNDPFIVKNCIDNGTADRNGRTFDIAL